MSFLLVFKSGQGYGNYLEGRKQLGTCVSNQPSRRHKTLKPARTHARIGGFCNNCRELAQFAYTYKLKADADMVKVGRGDIDALTILNFGTI